MHFSAVAPPRGERGLKSSAPVKVGKAPPRRSPSWGAWIEMMFLPSVLNMPLLVAPPRGERGLKYLAGFSRQAHTCRSPSWGAWIEMYTARIGATSGDGRSPSWGAWIEILHTARSWCSSLRRSPSWGAWIEIYCSTTLFFFRATSLPLVGSVD